MSRRVEQLGPEIPGELARFGGPLRPADLGARLLGHPPTAGERAALLRLLEALADRGVLTLQRDAAGDLLCWVPGDLARLAASAPAHAWASLPRSPRRDADALPGTRALHRLRPETPRWVWTLHRHPLARVPTAMAVRRWVLSDEGGLHLEIARSGVAFVPARELALSGSARTCRAADTGSFHPLLQVYDHCPTEEERRAWLLRRAREQRALTAAAPPVWLILPGDPGGPDRALRCSTRRAPPDRLGEGSSRADLELRLPFRAFRDAPRVSALDLAVHGLARITVARSRFLVCAVEPVALLLGQTAAERRARGEDAWFREDAAPLVAPPRTAAITEGAAALAELGLALPCTAHELGRAFRKRVMADRAHPDQGGSEEEFHELMRLRSLAMALVEASASPARPAA